MSTHERIHRLLVDSESDPMITLSAAARLFPGEGKKGVSPTSVYRWGRRGLPLADGRVIKLKMWRIGRKWVTTRSALAEFIELQQPDVADQDVFPRTASQRRNASDQASRALEDEGA